MNKIATLARRELSAYFLSPIAYVVISVFLLLMGLFFGRQNFDTGLECSLRATLGAFLPMVLVFILPILTMRLLAEEFRSGTIETLMTAPISDASVVLGKFLGCLLFYLVLLMTTLPYVVFLEMYGTLDYGMLFCGYLGVFLVGSLFISVGLFFSAWTKNQIVAVLCSFVLLAIMTFLANYLASQTQGVFRVVLLQVSVLTHFQDFARGILSTNDLVFFCSMTALFLFWSVKVLESRRWR